MSLDAHRKSLLADINEWADRQITIGETMPDFWDEADTSARLTEWLLALGYRKVESEFSHRQGDVVSVETKIDI